MSTNELLKLANQVAEIIRPRRLRSRSAPELPPAGMAATELLAAARAATPQGLLLRQRYQVAAEEAVRDLERGQEVASRYHADDERSRARLARDANRLGEVMSANGNSFYFGRHARGPEYTREQAASMEARIRADLAKANLLPEFSVPLHFSSFLV
ncbi:unnamed protein product [marine sediment metagenome]|uniref:Uncharacterized protein n=1 Tax=marine sediment metagenome TaxID=412755 RepID=X1LBV1_9ZZZZ